jgi:hypothetical protein
VQRDSCIAVNRPLHVPVFAVHGRADRLFGERFRNAFGDLRGGDPCVIVTCIAVGKSK